MDAVRGGAVPRPVPRDPRRRPRQAARSRWSYLPPERYPVWKALLRDGRIDAADAAAVGDVLGPHPRGAPPTDPDVAARVRAPTTSSTRSASSRTWSRPAARIPTSRARFDALVATTATHRRVLVHGDFSPKNILVGAARPGDPRRRVRVVRRPGVRRRVRAQPPAAEGRMAAAVARALYAKHSRRWSSAYLRARRVGAAGDARARARRRCCPALLLARVDGKSPVEYVTEDADTRRVRAFARQHARASRRARRATVRATAWFGAIGASSRERAIDRVHRRGASGIRAAARPSRPRSSSPAARAGARSRRPARRAARARRSTCATAARASAASTCCGAIAAGRRRDRARRLQGRDARDQAGADAALIALDGTPEQVAARRQRDCARCRSPSRTPRRPRAALPLWRYLAGDGAGDAAAAGDPDLRRRRARGTRASTSRT